MTQAEYDVHRAFILDVAASIENAKRPGYTRGDTDVLANFKRAGAAAGVTPEQAWTVFFLKHIDAIVTHMTQPALPISEGMSGRFADALNYLKLGWALLQEREQADLRLAEDLMKGTVEAYNAEGGLEGDECPCPAHVGPEEAA